MALKRGRPGNPKVRSGKCVGPDFPAGKFYSPYNADIDFTFGGDRDDKTVLSEAGLTFEGGGAEVEEGRYDPLWEGK
jgi:hypothetical protein